MSKGSSEFLLVNLFAIVFIVEASLLAILWLPTRLWRKLRMWAQYN